MTPQRILNGRGAILLAGLALSALAVSVGPSAASPQGSGGNGNTNQNEARRPVPTFPAFGTADSNQTMIAVTGVDMTGTSILYLVDTSTRHLAVYQANGGGESTQSLKLVGARRIDLDLQLDGYNDKSEYSVQELEKKFNEIGRGSRPTK